MSARVHGGTDRESVPVYDFSTNSNACGPCPQALYEVLRAQRTRYPDHTMAAVREALADLHSVVPERIVISASASEFIFRFTSWAARSGCRTFTVPRHAYGDYGHAARAWRLSPSSSGDIVWCCDPSSPLGHDDADVAQSVARGTLVVLDRAYEPLRLSGECLHSPATLGAVWQLWTPNKALGLTGVRGAYAISPIGADARVRELEELAPSWPLGADGEAMLLAWATPPVQDWVAGTHATLGAWKRRQSEVCAALGWTLHPSEANYFTAQVPGGSASLAGLRRNGIKLRDATSFGLPSHARLAVRSPDAQEALARAWKAVA